MSAALLTRLETADTSADRLVLFDELCASTADCPDRLGSFLHFIQPAFCDPLRGVRSLAFQCARNYIAANPGMAEYFTSSYFMALLHNQADIALHALSVLPELVVVGRSIAPLLLNAATTTVQRWQTQAAVADLCRAIAAFHSSSPEEVSTPSSPPTSS